MNWKIHVHCSVRNESICYIVLIDRTKPDNSVRVNPATRHSETKYGFVILTGDMIFKDFFVQYSIGCYRIADKRGSPVDPLRQMTGSLATSAYDAPGEGIAAEIGDVFCQHRSVSAS